MANELYGITEYLNVKELKQKSEELKNKLNKTKKKMKLSLMQLIQEKEKIQEQLKIMKLIFIIKKKK